MLDKINAVKAAIGIGNPPPIPSKAALNQQTGSPTPSAPQSRPHTPPGQVSGGPVSPRASTVSPNPIQVDTARPYTPSAVPRPTSATVQRREQRVGPYILGKTLGTGSTGRVKLGTHCETGEKVAVKIIPKETRAKAKEGQDHTEVVEKKLEREIAIMKLIKHPSVLALFDVYESEDELYLIMELVDGGELFDYIVKNGRLKEAEAVIFFQQIIAGIAFCHQHLICHRDLKPENLLLDSSKNIKIADFGMASLQRTDALLETSCGSPHYASPEGVKYDGRLADVWSCGIILYALVTGTLPFDDPNIRKLLAKVKAGVYTIPDYVSPEAADLIRKMLQMEPEKRIKMEDIERHPWFNLVPYRRRVSGGSSNPLSNPPTIEALQPWTDDQLSRLDPDILASLCAMGFKDEHQVVRSLQSPEPNYEKIFYYVLKSKKNEILEKGWYLADSNGNLSDPKSPRRRVHSYGSANSIYGDLSQAVSLQGSINGSSNDLVANADRKSVIGTPSNDRRSVVNPVSAIVASEKRQTIIDKRRSHIVSSPLSTTAPTNAHNIAPEEPNLDKPLPPIIPKQAINNSPPPPQADQEIALKMKAALEAYEMLSKSTNSEDVNKTLVPDFQSASPATTLAVDKMTISSNGTTKQSGSGGTTLVLDHPSEKSKSNTSTVNAPEVITNLSKHSAVQNDIAPGSPMISNGIKRRWFENLFNFTPEKWSFQLEATLAQSREQLIFLCQNFEILFQDSSDGLSLKCKFDNHQKLAATKFKIMFAKDGDRTEVSLLHQQGSLSTFEELKDQIRTFLSSP